LSPPGIPLVPKNFILDGVLAISFCIGQQLIRYPISFPWSLDFFQDKPSGKEEPDYRFDKSMVIRFLLSACNFGNPAIPVGPVAFRPTIARGLALCFVPDYSRYIEEQL